METDYWAHRYYEDPKLKEEIEDEEFDLQEVLQSMEDGDWEVVASMGVKP